MFGLEAHHVSQEMLSDEKIPLVPKSGAKDWRFGCFGLFGFLYNLQQAFGLRFLFVLFIVQHVLKGFVLEFASITTPYLLKLHSIPATQMQIYTGVCMLPFAMKPAIGLISDILPISAFNKAPYMLLTSAFGFLGLLTVGLMPAASFPVQIVVMLLFFFVLQVSTCDLLTEAKYAEMIKLRPSDGPAILAFVWFGNSFANLVAALLSGIVIQHFGPQAPCFFGAWPSLVVVVPLLLGYLPEERVTEEQLRKVRKRFYAQKEICFLCLLMLVCALSNMVCGIRSEDPHVNAAVGIIGGLAIIGSCWVLLTPTIAKFFTFSIVQSSMALNISGAVFFFYTDSPEAYPNGPHFSPIFYTTVMRTVGALCSLVGIWTYTRFMKSWTYRSLLVSTNIFFSGLCMLDVALFRRANLSWGIPDKHFVLGGSALQSVAHMWMWMPQVIIYSHLCPAGMEATMYALLAGAANLGMSISSSNGALLLHMLGSKPRGGPGDAGQFEYLWLASFISSILPLVSVTSAFWLVPTARQDEGLSDVDVAAGDAMAGSLWRRYTRPAEEATVT
eukprot:TRINITY_DN20676_c0_g1_i1.p1 TRINITY_DN20676_c0_g1~~TRINITY_DN20676_c0_g1_i1.p1  ORF type:complete len:557 (-),score=73.64 TRINITY_DN20676_c0_g1_i1:105-1775(-)